MIGSAISHYRILEKIGQGGMGEVFLAEDTKLDRKVALKFLPAQFSADERSASASSTRPRRRPPSTTRISLPSTKSANMKDRSSLPWNTLKGGH